MTNQSEIVYPNDIARKNPRVGHRMPIKISFQGFEIRGCTNVVSAFGATVEIDEKSFNYLQDLETLPKVTIQTDMILADAECNGLSKHENKFLVGIRLSDGFTWYGKNV